MILRITILSLCIVLGAKSQENAASSVAKSILECYNTTDNLDKERRPPSSISVLIEFLRKIESGASMQNDREFSKEIIHRFKQDGIVRFSTSENSPYAVPYTPNGMQGDKHKLLLRKLVPGNAVNFPNETLNELERCSLHFMLSNTITLKQRGDEANVCNRLDRFQRRMRRGVDPDSEVELFDPSKFNEQKGKFQNELHPEAGDGEVETGVERERGSSGSSRSALPFTYSECPIEDGVVYTRWGAIQAGLVISGMAAGREIQNIPTEENHVVNNMFGATLAGDLAEVGLHQGAAGNQIVHVGVKGGWNGTQVPKWYFIEKSTDFEMTDAEIRGGLDGLIIAKNMKMWQGKAQSLKMSQLLDMYYSSRGVFSKKYRACNRKQLLTEVTSTQELTDQTIAFSFLLDGEAELPGSMSPEGINTYGKKAVDALNDYIPNMQDLSCEIESDTIARINTDILIILDTQWDFKPIYYALSYFLDNIDINRYDSNFTILNAQTGEMIVNSSSSILDFYFNYNKTVHEQNQNGFDVTRIFNIIEVMAKLKMDDAVRNRKAGGQSTIVLFVPSNTISDTDKMVINEKKQYFKTRIPDLKLLVLGRNSHEPYTDLVFDPSSDAFSLSGTSVDGSSITESMNRLISRVKEIHRTIVNPNCGSNWSGNPSSDSLEQYVEPNSVNYYRVAPNYIFGEGERAIKVRRNGYGNLAVCMSRTNEKPSKNATDGTDVRCETLSSNEVSFPLTNACQNYDYVYQCPAVYMSVEAVTNGQESNNFGCRDQGCRFPDNIKYSIQVENFGCYSRSYRNIGNFFIILFMLFTISSFF